MQKNKKGSIRGIDILKMMEKKFSTFFRLYDGAMVGQGVNDELKNRAKYMISA